MRDLNPRPFGVTNCDLNHHAIVTSNSDTCIELAVTDLLCVATKKQITTHFLHAGLEPMTIWCNKLRSEPPRYRHE